MELDLNRGLTSKRHPKTGASVSMYKDEPGVFLSPSGTEVSTQLAREAGFDVEALHKERRLREKRAEAEIRIRTEVEAEFTERVESESSELSEDDDEEGVKILRRSASTTKSPGEPRETLFANMEFHGGGPGSDGFWSVIHKPDGAVLADKVEREEALGILLSTKE